jgi:carboxymethylenebutenolidase
MAGNIVEFPSNGKTASGYLAVSSDGKGPGVIVIQEWWGLVPHIKDVCDRFAAAGYTALAPDLYHGAVAKSPDEAGKYMMSLRIDEAEKDLRGACEFLAAHQATAGNKIGTVGFCMGGALSLYAACKNPQVGACVIFYGIHPNVKPDLANLQAPVLGLYAERDGFVTPAVVHELEDQLKKHGKTADMQIYPGVDHAFFNDTRPDVYNQPAAQDAWRRVLDFFAGHLGD